MKTWFTNRIVRISTTKYSRSHNQKFNSIPTAIIYQTLGIHIIRDLLIKTFISRHTDKLKAQEVR